MVVYKKNFIKGFFLPSPFSSIISLSGYTNPFFLFLFLSTLFSLWFFLSGISSHSYLVRLATEFSFFGSVIHSLTHLHIPLIQYTPYPLSHTQVSHSHTYLVLRPLRPPLSSLLFYFSVHIFLSSFPFSIFSMSWTLLRTFFSETIYFTLPFQVSHSLLISFLFRS